MKTQAYANTKDGYHVCLSCVQPEETEVFYPLTAGMLYEYTYADYELGISESPNYPSCDRCREEIEFQSSEEKARTQVSIIGNLLGREVAEETDDIDGFQESFTQYSEWSNDYLPMFRQLAGYKDHGVGTYTDNNGDENLMYIVIDLEDTFWAGVERGFNARRSSLEKLNTFDAKENL